MNLCLLPPGSLHCFQSFQDFIYVPLDFYTVANVFLAFYVWLFLQPLYSLQMLITPPPLDPGVVVKD